MQREERNQEEEQEEEALVSVVSSPFMERLPVAGMTVREIRARYRDRLEIDPRSQPVLHWLPVTEDTVVRGGQNLVFVRQSGEIGGN